ncbi:hypothetical protein Z043_120492 [Scleropages formosus]|uniref:Uncharacterized protein n=1 Tax=Scleropages formosus TaxID=113540 RepID=A0A0P7U3C4_SCLFO|nr:hypothetical protein Z043_120492 [Scleropages formosus]
MGATMINDPVTRAPRARCHAVAKFSGAPANEELAEAGLRRSALRPLGARPGRLQWQEKSGGSSAAAGAMATTASNHYGILAAGPPIAHSEPGSMQQSVAYRDGQSLLQGDFGAHPLSHAHQWIAALSHGDGSAWSPGALGGEADAKPHAPRAPHAVHHAHGSPHDTRAWGNPAAAHAPGAAPSGGQGLAYSQAGFAPDGKEKRMTPPCGGALPPGEEHVYGDTPPHHGGHTPGH